MSDVEAQEELDALVRRHAGTLDAEDLRDLGDRLEEWADKWEAM